MSSVFLALWQSLVLSANLDILLMILVSKSFIYIRNSSRHNTLPCGTLDVTGAQLLDYWLMHTRWQRSANKFRIHLAASP